MDDRWMDDGWMNGWMDEWILEPQFQMFISELFLTALLFFIFPFTVEEILPENWGKGDRKVTEGRYGQRSLCLKGELNATIGKQSRRLEPDRLGSKSSSISSRCVTTVLPQQLLFPSMSKG